ncbi:MAG: hypothetical protein H6Q15_2434 [Bacteroidetes bacterium]|nr:hypothetical protein [Bacteroidota bacterium]
MKYVTFFCFFSFLTIQNIFSQNDKPPLTTDSLSFELCKLYAADQCLRNYIPDSINSQIRWSFIQKIDSINFYKSIDFIKKHGFPSRKEYRNNFDFECVNAALICIFLHNPQRVIKQEIYDLLKAEVRKGNLSSLTFSYILDRYYVIYKKYSLYGSPYKTWTPCKGVRFEDKEKVNNARLDIGLEALPDSCFIHY